MTAEPSVPTTGSTTGYVLTLSCADRPRIVHAVTGFLVEQGGNITESQQYGDPISATFFMRIAFEVPAEADVLAGAARLREAFAPVAEEFAMSFALHGAGVPTRTMILVSRDLHCLNDLLFRTSTGTLPIEVPLIVSNHPDAQRLAASYDIPLEVVPVTAATKPEAEARLLELAREHDVELVVLARYMQILSDDLCRALAGRAINIHHSFLPSFKGAKPYHQAFERGVKIVGATAHYVTADLDEGPIIEQDVLRADHAHTQQELAAAGRDVEAQVLARAVRWHAESRVLLNGHRTVVFR